MGAKGERPRKKRVLHVKPADLWPQDGSGSVIQAGGVSVQFQSGRKGRRVKVTSKRHKPSFRVLQKRGKGA